MHGEWRHSKPDLSLGELGTQLGRPIHMESIGFLRDRCAQPESWIRRCGPGLRPREPHQRSQPRLHLQQRRADLAHTQSLLPFTTSYRTRNMSFYVQDQWTLGRMTLQGALRVDRNWSLSPEQRIPASNFLANPIVFPETPGVDAYKDISPRGGPAYDVFGNGKTAVKVNFGKYLEPTSNNNNYILANPITRIATTAARGWTDSNGNRTPDCDLRNQAAQNLTATGGDICAASNAQTFGTAAQTTANIDPKILSGWSVRSN